MKYIFFVLLAIIILYILAKNLIFSYVPKNKNIGVYKVKWAHRGLHFAYPENTLGAYEEAIKNGLGIELDIRETKDKKIICFHDRYTKRLLGIPGVVSHFEYNDLKNRKVKGSTEYVCTLKEALKLIDKRVPILVEVKGFLSKSFRRELLYIFFEYKGEVYFHTKNLQTYISLITLFRSYSVFFVCNIFRKRFPFIKGKHYKDALTKYQNVQANYVSTSSLQIPTIEDISQVLVKAFENSDSVREVCATVSAILNKYQSRVDEKHWLNTSLLLHRSIVSDEYRENSIEAFKAAIDFANSNRLNVALELDVIWYKNEIRCYHSDRVSSRLGQEASCAEKVARDKSILFEDVLRLVNGYDNISLIIDIKDYKYKNRILEKSLVELIERIGFTGKFAVQSFNPLVLMWFEKNRPDYIRGQVGHSLSGLTKFVPFFRFPWAVNVLLFDKSSADYAVYDNSNFIYLFIKYNKDIKGRSVLIYAPQNYNDIETFIGKEGISNFIVENVTNSDAWPDWWIDQFRIK